MWVVVHPETKSAPRVTEASVKEEPRRINGSCVPVFFKGIKKNVGANAAEREMMLLNSDFPQ